MSKTHRNSALFATIKVTLPLFFGYLAIGMPFGLMLVKEGYPWWLAPLMSITMYAGAGQYMALGLFASGASLSSIAVAELMINIRHIVYGLSLIGKFKNTGKIKPYLIFALTDETYALMTAVPLPYGQEPAKFYGTIAALDQAYWILGSLIGALAGYVIPFDFKGVDFALTALFAVLLVEQIKATKEVLPPIIGGIVTILCIVVGRFIPFVADNILILALCFGIGCLMLVKAKNIGKENSIEEDKNASNT